MFICLFIYLSVYCGGREAVRLREVSVRLCRLYCSLRTVLYLTPKAVQHQSARDTWMTWSLLRRPQPHDSSSGHIHVQPFESCSLKMKFATLKVAGGQSRGVRNKISGHGPATCVAFLFYEGNTELVDRHSAVAKGIILCLC